MEFRSWLITALVFGIVEIIAPGFVLIWFAVGAVAAGLLVLFGVESTALEVLVFVAVSLAGVALSRTLWKNVFMRSSPGTGLKTNMDAMIGKAGIVTETIDAGHGTGRVVVDGQDWSAKSTDPDPIDCDASIRIMRVEGARLVVKRG